MADFDTAVRISLARLEEKVDGIFGLLTERQKENERRFKSLESSRAKVLTLTAGWIGSLLLTGIYALAHVR